MQFLIEIIKRTFPEFLALDCIVEEIQTNVNKFVAYNLINRRMFFHKNSVFFFVWHFRNAIRNDAFTEDLETVLTSETTDFFRQ